MVFLGQGDGEMDVRATAVGSILAGHKMQIDWIFGREDLDAVGDIRCRLAVDVRSQDCTALWRLRGRPWVCLCRKW